MIGLLLLLGGNGGVVWPSRRVNSGHAALVVGATPLWMVLIDSLRPGRKKAGRPDDCERADRLCWPRVV